jgi:hypothetical protein
LLSILSTPAGTAGFFADAGGYTPFSFAFTSSRKFPPANGGRPVRAK